MKETEIKELFRSYLVKTEKDNLEIKETDDKNYNMFYQLEEDCIYYNLSMLKNSAKDHELEFLEYVQIIICHELGHAIDDKLKNNHQRTIALWERINKEPLSKMNKQFLKDIGNMNYENEKKAWDNGSKLIGKALKEKFELVKTKSLVDAKETIKLEQQLWELRLKSLKQSLSSHD